MLTEPFYGFSLYVLFLPKNSMCKESGTKPFYVLVFVQLGAPKGLMVTLA